MVISDKINQWTLLVGMLPIAMSIGAHSLSTMPLDARQHEEFFLTAAQSLFALALLLPLRLSLWSAVALVSLFVIQLALAFFYQATPEREIAVLTALAWVYLALAVILLVWHARRVPALARAAFGTVPQAE